MAINVGPSMGMGQTLPPGGPRPAGPKPIKKKKPMGMVSSHGPGSGAPPTARRQPTGMISSHGPGSGAPPTAKPLPRMAGSHGPGTPPMLPFGNGGMNPMPRPMGPQFDPSGGGFMGGQPGASPVPMMQPPPQNPMMDYGGMASEGPPPGMIDTGPSMQYDMGQMNPNSGIAGPNIGNQLSQMFPQASGMWGNIFNKMSQNNQMGPMGGAGGILSKLYGGGAGRGMFGGMFGR